jgi:Na+-transporting NADH:ubiquinone oxidoreductase subunit C
MNINSNTYVLGFATVVCVAVSTALALAATALKDLQAAAREFDRQKNVMIAAGLCTADDERPQAELEKLYAERVGETVVDVEQGKVADGVTLQDVARFRSDQDRNRYRVVAMTKDAAGAVEAYVLPVDGKGLWGGMFGYLALDGDKNHVRGVTFYQHVETPGLGGEVDNAKWKQQWVGKTVLDADGKLTSVTIKKGKVDPAVAAEQAHFVDGMSGATITGKKVTEFVRKDLEAFAKYLQWK